MKKKIKVKVNLEFELPIEEFENNPVFKDHGKDFVHQTVFDAVNNYLVVCHLRDATHWCNRDKILFHHHNYWADLLEKTGYKEDAIKIEIVEE